MKKVLLNKKIWFSLALVLVFIGYYKFVNRNSIKFISVKEVKIENRQVIKTISASGKVKGIKEADLSFNVLGTINKIYVKKGDEIEKGKLLSSLSNYADYQSIQSYKDARDIALRDRDLFIENYQSDHNDYGRDNAYQIRLRQLNEEISKAEATYKSKLADLSDTYIYSPFKGKVIDVTKEQGESAAANEKIIKIADNSSLIFEIELDQEDYGYIKLGQDADIQLDSYDTHVFKGKITELPDYADGGATSSFVVKLSIEPSGQYIPLIGMTGDAHIIVESTIESVPSVSYDEVFFDEQDKPYLWVVDSGLIKKMPVEVGLQGDIYTHIKSQVENTVVVGVNSDTEVKEGYRPKFVKK